MEISLFHNDCCDEKDAEDTTENSGVMEASRSRTSAEDKTKTETETATETETEIDGSKSTINDHIKRWTITRAAKEKNEKHM